MCANYGDSALSHRVVNEWIEMFKNVWVWLVRNAWVVRPQLQLHRMKKELRDWFFKTEEWQLTKLQNNWISALGSAYSVVHDNLQFHKVCAR
jgi:hypothetical protein